MTSRPDPDVLTVALIAEARKRGLTWAQIGSVTIGRPDPRAAKAHAKKAARRAARHAGTQGAPHA